MTVKELERPKPFTKRIVNNNKNKRDVDKILESKNRPKTGKRPRLEKAKFFTPFYFMEH